MGEQYGFSLQHQFDQVKRNAGITADVKFYNYGRGSERQRPACIGG